MPIINITPGQAGLVGVLPSLAFIETDDPIATILTAGYLNKAVQGGLQLSYPCMAIVSSQESPGALINTQMLQIVSNGVNSTVIIPSGNVDPGIVNHLAIYGVGGKTVSAFSAQNSSVLGSDATGIPAWLGPMTNGQIIIGSNGAIPVATTLTAGANITITNTAGAITIASSGGGGSSWVDQATGAVTMVTNTGYTSDDGASLVSFTLPTASAIGDFVEINGNGSGLWKILQAAGQQIQISPNATTLGAGGSLASVNQYDNVRLRCLVANTIWTVVSQQSTGLTRV